MSLVVIAPMMVVLAAAQRGEDGNFLAFVSLVSGPGRRVGHARQSGALLVGAGLTRTAARHGEEHTRYMAKRHIFEPLLRRGEGRCRLVNRTKGIILAETVEPAFDSRTRRTGLLGRDGLAGDAVLAIAPSNAVHTIGMRFPIDVLFITRAGRVTKRVLQLRPLRIAASLSAFAVLEFAAGHPAVAGTAVGDEVVLETV